MTSKNCDYFLANGFVKAVIVLIEGRRDESIEKICWLKKKKIVG